MVSPILRLPPEMLIECLQYVDEATLKNCTEVNKSWSATAKTMEEFTIKIEFGGAFTKLLQNLQQYLGFGDRVKCILIDVNEEEEEISKFGSIVNLCPNLTSIIVGRRYHDQTDLSIFKALKEQEIRLPNIQRIIKLSRRWGPISDIVSEYYQQANIKFSSTISDLVIPHGFKWKEYNTSGMYDYVSQFPRLKTIKSYSNFKVINLDKLIGSCADNVQDILVDNTKIEFDQPRVVQAGTSKENLMLKKINITVTMNGKYLEQLFDFIMDGRFKNLQSVVVMVYAEHDGTYASINSDLVETLTLYCQKHFDVVNIAIESTAADINYHHSLRMNKNKSDQLVVLKNTSRNSSPDEYFNDDENVDVTLYDVDDDYDDYGYYDEENANFYRRDYEDFY